MRRSLTAQTRPERPSPQAVLLGAPSSFVFAADTRAGQDKRKVSALRRDRLIGARSRRSSSQERGNCSRIGQAALRWASTVHFSMAAGLARISGSGHHKDDGNNAPGLCGGTGRYDSRCEWRFERLIRREMRQAALASVSTQSKAPLPGGPVIDFGRVGDGCHDLHAAREIGAQ